MVIACHIIFGAYGFWLPNDPRGSWSTEVRAPHLRRFGPATKVSTSRSLAHQEHDHAKRLAAKRNLKYPAVRFTGLQARAVARGIARAVDQLQLTVFACSIMPDHVHLVTQRHRRKAEYLTGFLKRAATRQLNAERLHPMAKYRSAGGRVPTPWAEKGWVVYLETAEKIRRRIRYVEQNPVEEGLRQQRWSFVVSYKG